MDNLLHLPIQFDSIPLLLLELSARLRADVEEFLAPPLQSRCPSQFAEADVSEWSLDHVTNENPADDG
jgi:hypothetical protein